jgi:hypothetical protein
MCASLAGYSCEKRMMSVCRVIKDRCNTLN